MQVHPAMATSDPITQQPRGQEQPTAPIEKLLAHKHRSSGCENCCLCFGEICYRLPHIYMRGFQTLTTYQRAVVFRLGVLKSKKPLGPGLIQFNPVLEKLKIVDIRETSFDMPAQNLLTRDTLMCSVDAVVYYRGYLGSLYFVIFHLFYLFLISIYIINFEHTL